MKTSSTDQFSASITPFEVPEQMRAFVEKGVLQVRDNYAKFKDAAETHSGTVEVVFTTASKGANEYTVKLMEFLKANTASTLDFTQELLGVKTPAEATELWTSHSRKSFETFSAQAKELAQLGQKVVTETVEPIKTSASAQANKLAELGQKVATETVEPLKTSASAQTNEPRREFGQKVVTGTVEPLKTSASKYYKSAA